MRPSAHWLTAGIVSPGRVNPAYRRRPKFSADARAASDLRSRQTGVHADVCRVSPSYGARAGRTRAPLVDSEWVLGSPERLARIIIHGVRGPISVNGAVQPEMPALSILPDADIAAVMTYIRREWEHAADPVEEKTVSVIRKATQDREDLWTSKELMEIKPGKTASVSIDAAKSKPITAFMVTGVDDRF